MKVEQIYTIVNELSNDVLGKDTPSEINLNNVIDVGKQMLDSTDIENFTRKLIDHIGKVVFVNRPYSGRAPSVLMQDWEYGSILEKIDCDIPEAEMNPTWNLQNGQTYNQDEFQGPTGVTARFWNSKVTFQVHMSFADEQVKSAFSNLTQLNAFFSMIYTKIDISFTIKLDALIMQTINNFTANVYNAGRGINLLEEFLADFPDKTLTPAQALMDLDFLKYAARRIRLVSKHMTNASVAFNNGGRVRHTPLDLQHIIMLDSFATSADIYLQSDTYHNELTKLPSAETVSFWQGSGTKYAFEDVSSINVVPQTESGVGNQTQIAGIIAVIFDRDALGVNNYNRRATKHYNGAAEFINNWYKMDAQYFNDFNENFVFFYIATPATGASTRAVKK